MDFVDLVRLDNQLESLTMTNFKQQVAKQFEHILHETQLPKAGIEEIFYDNLKSRHEILFDGFNGFELELNELKQEVKRRVQVEGRSWLQQSYRRYEDQLETKHRQSQEAVTWHQNRPVVLDPDLQTMLTNRVAYYCDWHYPAMIVHPVAQQAFFDAMIESDILYVADENPYLIDTVLEKYNETYRARLRINHIEESFDQPILPGVPDAQLGFCLIYNFLDFKPFEMIQKYLTEIYQKLQPGGTCALTYTDCSRYQAISLVTQEIVCYTPGNLIEAWAERVGFEKTFYHKDNGPSVWIELKKPGQLRSIKGGQTLAKIIPKPVAKSK
jgi:hypothetical protein